MEIEPIKGRRDYRRALKEIEGLMHAKRNTPQGDRLDVLATLIDAYEAEHDPMDPPTPSRRSSSAWSSKASAAATWRTSSERARALPRFCAANADYQSA